MTNEQAQIIREATYKLRDIACKNSVLEYELHEIATAIYNTTLDQPMPVIKLKGFKDVDPTELVQMLANAFRTYNDALGHKKADRNDSMADEYRAKLKALGASIPSDKKLLEMGIFNGKGSC